MTCVSAEGRVSPTFLIYEKGLPNVSIEDDLLKAWLYGHSPNGKYLKLISHIYKNGLTDRNEASLKAVQK